MEKKGKVRGTNIQGAALTGDANQCSRGGFAWRGGYYGGKGVVVVVCY